MDTVDKSGSWWTEGIRQSWLGSYETELVYFLQEKYGVLSEEQQLVVVFLSLFLKSGHTTLPLYHPPRKWGETVGLPPGSSRLLSTEPIRPTSLMVSHGAVSGEGAVRDGDSIPGEGTLTGAGSLKGENSVKNNELVSDSHEKLTPLVVSGNRVSFRRQSLYENFISDWIFRRSKGTSLRSNMNSTDSPGVSQETDCESDDHSRDPDGPSRKPAAPTRPSSEHAVQETLYDLAEIASELKKLYPEDEREMDWQKTAVALSALQTFTIISGGPGTGKTTTVANLLTLRIRLSESPLRIALAAPTGKAAGRMAEALRRQWDRLKLTDDETGQIPEEAKTIHRLLSGTGQRGLLPSVRRRTLPYDLIVVDEASMIDLHLMYRLLSHLDEKTTLILLGDRNQLASVEAGSVFSDLCRKQENSFTPQTAKLLRQAGIESPLPVVPEGESPSDVRTKDAHGATESSDSAVVSVTGTSPGSTDNSLRNSHPGAAGDSIIYLTKSYRYDETSGIGRLSEAVLSGDPGQQQNLFQEYADLHHHPFQFSKTDVQQLMDDIYQDYLEASVLRQPEDLFAYWKQKMRLTVLRHGPSGSVRLNSFAEQQIMLKRPGLVRDGWYHGRPFIITQNDYALGVFNGDTGVCILTSDGDLEVHVESGTGVKVFVPGQLVHAEPAYFLTVHKSQGSEFDHVYLILPQNDTPILSRELIYTAISRARTSFHLAGEMELFLKGSGRRTQRYTGMGSMLNSPTLSSGSL